jgi:6-phospho-beta-glucosidase
LMQQVKAVERLAIDAAFTRADDPARADELELQAFALHPLVDSVGVARELAHAYRSAWRGSASP